MRSIILVVFLVTIESMKPEWVGNHQTLMNLLALATLASIVNDIMTFLKKEKI